MEIKESKQRKRNIKDGEGIPEGVEQKKGKEKKVKMMLKGMRKEWKRKRKGRER